MTCARSAGQGCPEVRLSALSAAAPRGASSVLCAIRLDPAVIAADNVIVFADLKNPMQNVLSAVPLIQRNIILFKPAVNRLYDKQVPVLFY